MAMNLVQQGEDLQDFSDEALANELQTGQRGYLPVAVLSEIERRTRDRQRYQQTMAAQQAEAPPVVQARLMEFMAQAQPSPEMGMAPEMAPEMAAMPPQGIMAAQPEMAPMSAEAPTGIASMMPPQQMAEGGMVRRAQTGMTSTDPLGYLVGEGMTAAGRGIAGTGRFVSQAGLSRPGYSSLLSATAMTEAERLRRRILAKEQINLDASQERAALAALEQTAAPAATSAPAGGQFSLPAAREASIFSERRPGTDYSGGAREVAERPALRMPSAPSFDFSSAYERNLGELQLQPVTIRSPRATEQSVRDASFFTEEANRLRRFAPDREKFDRSRQSDLLVGLGSVIAGATQRGDIAKGLAQLTAQQREAQREFRREELQYEMGLAGLRREERGERREIERERRQAQREEAAQEAALRTEARQMTALELEAEGKRQDAEYKIQNLAQQLELAQAKAEREGMNAQLKLLVDTITMQLRQAQTELALAQAAKARAEAAAAGRFSGSGATPAGQVFSSTAQ